MPNHFIYPIYTGLLVLLLFALVPKKEIRRLSVYAIIFGGLMDVLLIISTRILGMGGFVNFEPFGAFGIPLFPPIAWVAYFIMFFYILPRNKPWKYIFPLVAGSFSFFFSNVLMELGIIRWNDRLPILILLLIYIGWEFSVAWVYLKLIKEKKFDKWRTKYYLPVPAPAMKKERKGKNIKPIK